MTKDKLAEIHQRNLETQRRAAEKRDVESRAKALGLRTRSSARVSMFFGKLTTKIKIK